MVKSIQITSVVGLVYFLAAPAMAERQLLDRIVATVDDTAILHSTIEDKVKRGPLVLVSSYPASPVSKPFDQALQDKINLELVMKRAAELEIEVPEDRIDEQINNLTKHNNISVDQLREYLRQQGKSFGDYREDLRKQMIFMRFKGRELLPKVKITDRDVESYYIKNFGTSTSNLEVHLRHILVALPRTASTVVVDSKQKVVGQVFKKLQDGMNFRDAVRIYSDHPGARNEAEAFRTKLGDLPAELRNPVSKLEVGSFTSPIRTPAGFQIVYLEDKKFAASADYRNKKVELERKIREERLLQVTRSWLETARERAKIDIIAN